MLQGLFLENGRLVFAAIEDSSFVEAFVFV